jgi:hypothetical protein
MIVEIEQRRRHPRLSCTGDAVVHLFEESRDVAAKIEDLSVEGCRLRTIAALDLPVGKLLEISFSVNQLPFRVRARCRVLRSADVTGFQFVDLSRRAAGQLEELVKELFDDKLKETRGSKGSGGGIELAPAQTQGSKRRG